MKRLEYVHRFVGAFPDVLDEGTLYVSVNFAMAAHRCFCGCGGEVYTRISPVDWCMFFDGEHVSISPSVGNWSFSCQSHYFLDGSQVVWVATWSRKRIELERHRDRERRLRGGKTATTDTGAAEWIAHPSDCKCQDC